MNQDRSFRISVIALFGLLFFGTLGFRLVEHWDLFTCFYMTIITLTTVGYGEPIGMDRHGRYFAIVLILFGVVTMSYVLSVFSHRLIHSELLSTIGKRNLYKDISKLENHFIICGAGRIGSSIIKALAADESDFVIVEMGEHLADRYLQMGYLVLIGDATSEEVLRQAGAERARALVSVLASDADNVYVTLTASELNPHLYIVAKANEESAVNKLRQAGASKVVLPIQIGSHQIIQALLRPAVADFVEMATMSKDLDLTLEEIKIAGSSPLIGKALRDSGIRSDLEVIVIAAVHNNGEKSFNPSGDMRLKANDRLVVVGKPTNVKQLETLAAGQK
ncbi:MAG TPA: potassium channel protein [Blastocatellia bacterium]|nr:potassium channel protein [Blastocatellia bacterium]